MHKSLEVKEYLLKAKTRCASRIGLYTRLPLPIVYGMYCNTGLLGGNTILRDSVGDKEGGGASKGGVCE